MTQQEYKAKAEGIADKLGFRILVENNVVYIQSEEIKNELLHVSHPNLVWKLIFVELSQWNDGCDLISPVKIRQ